MIGRYERLAAPAVVLPAGFSPAAATPSFKADSAARSGHFGEIRGGAFAGTV